MKISGFTIAKNAGKLFYPVAPAIRSILPIVDEFIVGLGDSDTDDNTEEEISKIGSPKIKIVRSVWDVKKFPNGMEYARQTNLAKEACTGDWLFYIQSDEVLHEKYLPVVREACQKYISDPRVEGLLFNYKHFWGDFNHYIVSHAWYPREIRIIRNDKDIYSWRDAQSFRRIPHFDGINYYQKRGTRKLQVAAIDACIHHYRFVRPPRLMQKKSKNHNTNYRGSASTEARFKGDSVFDYGDLSKLHYYSETQPAVMAEWIQGFDWADQLKSPGKTNHKHERLKYRLLTLVEQNLLGGRQLFGFKNYVLVN
jgi:hypothetical protein